MHVADSLLVKRILYWASGGSYMARADVLLTFDVEVDDFQEAPAFLHDQSSDLS